MLIAGAMGQKGASRPKEVQAVQHKEQHGQVRQMWFIAVVVPSLVGLGGPRCRNLGFRV